MIFYHGTSKENWDKIQTEGVLWGYNIYEDENSNTYKGYRYTYLTPDIEIAKQYGSILLEVDYEPVGVDGRGVDNYGFDPPKGMTCWQFSVFIPIHLDKVKVLKIFNYGQVTT